MENSALIHSGGGSRGSYAAGVLWHMAHHVPEYRTGFSHLSGVSVGALNTCGIAHYPRHRFPEAADFLLRVWGLIRGPQSVYRYRYPYLPGKAKYLAALRHPSVAVTDPLRNLLTSIINPRHVAESGIHTRWPASCLDTQELQVFDQTSPDLVSAVMASSAFPGMFPPIEIDGRLYTDGGLLDTRPMQYALANRCERALVIMTRDPFAKKANPRPTNVLLRGRIEMDSMCDYLYARDVQKCIQINRIVVDDAGVADSGPHRNMPVTWIYPSKELASPMDFDYDTIQRQIEFGVQDARRFFDQRSG